MSVIDIRYANFIGLYKRFEEKCAKTNMRPTLQQFGETLWLPLGMASQYKCRAKNIGHAVARRIESHLGLEPGWMDRSHPDPRPSNPDEAEFQQLALELFRRDRKLAYRTLLELQSSLRA